MIFLKEDKYKNLAGVVIQIHVQPNSSGNQIVGLHGDRLKVKLASPPVDGKANQCLIEYFSEIFEIAKKHILLIRGESSREKTIFLNQLNLGQVKDFILKQNPKI